jgi:hypothetical protein
MVFPKFLSDHEENASFQIKQSGTALFRVLTFFKNIAQFSYPLRCPGNALVMNFGFKSLARPAVMMTLPADVVTHNTGHQSP